MAMAKVLKSGNSQAVRLPKAFWVERSMQPTARGRKSGSLTTFGMTSSEAGRSSFKARLPRAAQRVAALELLRELARVLPVMGLPETAADAYGTIRAELERKGQMI